VNLRRRQIALLAVAPGIARPRPPAKVRRIGTLSGRTSPKAKEEGGHRL
jgi:hypothetical protein